jgi:hypothetical protein
VLHEWLNNYALWREDTAQCAHSDPPRPSPALSTGVIRTGVARGRVLRTIRPPYHHTVPGTSAIDSARLPAPHISLPTCTGRGLLCRYRSTDHGPNHDPPTAETRRTRASRAHACACRAARKPRPGDCTQTHNVVRDRLHSDYTQQIDSNSGRQTSAGYTVTGTRESEPSASSPSHDIPTRPHLVVLLRRLPPPSTETRHHSLHGAAAHGCANERARNSFTRCHIQAVLECHPASRHIDNPMCPSHPSAFRQPPSAFR